MRRTGELYDTCPDWETAFLDFVSGLSRDARCSPANREAAGGFRFHLSGYLSKSKSRSKTTKTPKPLQIKDLGGSRIVLKRCNMQRSSADRVPAIRRDRNLNCLITMELRRNTEGSAAICDTSRILQQAAPGPGSPARFKAGRAGRISSRRSGSLAPRNPPRKGAVKERQGAVAYFRGGPRTTRGKRASRQFLT